MADFSGDDLRGSRFDRVDLRGSRFHTSRFADTVFEHILFKDAVMRDVDFIDVEITGEIENLVINGVDVGPFVEAELDRREPLRVKMRPTNAAGCREAWDVIEQLWAGTVERARSLDPALLHESVAGEWSFIETLRHLCFATDAWIRRGILGDPEPWHPLDLPWDQFPERLADAFPHDRTVRPSLDEVLAVRLDRMAGVRAYLAHLTDETFAGSTVPVPGESWPPSQSLPIRECLLTVFNEEWCHRKYAERDLDALTAAAG